MKSSSLPYALAVVAAILAGGAALVLNNWRWEYEVHALDRRVGQLEGKLDQVLSAQGILMGGPTAPDASRSLFPGSESDFLVSPGIEVDSGLTSTKLRNPNSDRTATIFYLKYVKADLAADLIQQTLLLTDKHNTSLKVHSDYRLNSLMVVGTSEDLDLVEKVLAEFDLPYQPTPKDLEVEQALGGMVEVKCEDAPLREALQLLGNQAGINVHIDQAGMGEEGVSANTPITLNLQNPISLKSALSLICSRLRLTYVIKDDVLFVTGESSNMAWSSKRQ